MKFKYLSVALLRIRTVSMWKVWFGFIVGTCDRRCSIYVLTNGEPCLPPTACLPGGELRTWGWGRQPVDLGVLGADVGEAEVEQGHARLGWSQSAWLTTRMQEGRVRGRGPADQEVLWHIMSNRNHGHGGAGRGSAFSGGSDIGTRERSGAEGEQRGPQDTGDGRLLPARSSSSTASTPVIFWLPDVADSNQEGKEESAPEGGAGSGMLVSLQPGQKASGVDCWD